MLQNSPKQTFEACYREELIKMLKMDILFDTLGRERDINFGNKKDTLQIELSQALISPVHQDMVKSSIKYVKYKGAAGPHVLLQSSCTQRWPTS